MILLLKKLNHTLASTFNLNTQELAKSIRVNTLNMVYKAKASHIGSCLSIADILAVLYGNVLKINPKNEYDESRDRFILSKGHACAALYSTLAELNFFNKHELNTYGEDFSSFMNHVSHKVPGVEFSTGSLGHGLPFGVGKALASKRKGHSWKTYVLLSDGEMDEGSNWEALMFAAHHKLSNLFAIIDYNKLQSLDTTENTLNLEPLQKKLESFGCFVLDVDGHSHEELKKSFSINLPSMPTVLIANTIKGKGVSFMENSVEWHYKNPNEDQLNQALQEIEVNSA